MQSATIWLTENCNLKCRYCYEGQEKGKRKFAISNITALISFIEREILESAKKEDKVIISFHGGEPLLELKMMKNIISDLDKISAKRNISIVYEVTTNGNVNEMEFLEYIKNREDFRISVSLEGTKEINDLFRMTKCGESSFDKAFWFAKQLLKTKKYPRIRMTLTPEMVEYLYENITFFIKEGFEMIVTVPDFFDKKWEQWHLVKIEEQLYKIYGYCRDISTEPQISLLDQTSYLKKVGRCFGGITEINIGCDGLLYPCTYTVNNMKYCIGNIWTGVDRVKEKKLLTLYEKNNEECFGCGLESACICTRCKFLNEAITGNCTAPVPIICGFMNVFYRFFRNVNTNSLKIIKQ